jgi:IMP dehydrogenase
LIEVLPMGLTFDDVLIVPKYSEVYSRKSVSLSTRLVGDIYIDVPFISANMDTVTGPLMASTLRQEGAVGVIHRFMAFDEHVDAVRDQRDPRILCIGVKEEDLNKVRAIGNNAEAVLIDVAHGHHKRVVDMIKAVREINPALFVIAGNVATFSGAWDLLLAGADSIKVGVGPGAACSTRTVAGAGFPQLSAIMNASLAVREYEKYHGKRATLIADGGIKKSADIVKALAAGADTVMIGSLFAGTDESPGEVVVSETGRMKKYRGSSSSEVNQYLGLDRTAEGVATLIPYRGSVRKIVQDLAGGVRSGLSYAGCSTIEELHNDQIQMVQVTSAGQYESRPNILEKANS